MAEINRKIERRDTGYVAFRILQFAFVIVPIVAGIDKFLLLLTNWRQYVSQAVPEISTFTVSTILIIVGIVEILAGLAVLWKPKVFSYVVAAWLFLVIINLAILGGYYDIILRDFGLMLSAIALGLLSHRYSRP